MPRTGYYHQNFNFSEFAKTVIASLPRFAHTMIFVEFIDDKLALTAAESIYNAVSVHIRLVLDLREAYHVPIITVGPVPQYTWDMTYEQREEEETRCVYLTNCLIAMAGRYTVWLFLRRAWCSASGRIMFIPANGTNCLIGRMNCYSILKGPPVPLGSSQGD